MDRWRRFWRLSAAERGLFLRAMILLPVTAAGLRIAGFRRWHAVLAHFLSAAGKTPASITQNSPDAAFQIARMICAAERCGPGRPNCLKESLVLWWMLRRRGLDSELRIGVRKEGEKFAAHAWVEYRGVVVNDRDAVHMHYTPLEGSLTATEAGPR